MTQQPLIWAIDIARVTGLAIGRVGDKPTARSIEVATVGADSNKVFVGCLRWFDDALQQGPLPDILAIEELLPPLARRGHTSTGAQHKLAGMHGIIRALAVRHGVPEIASANVLDVRQHFIHHRSFPRDKAKRAVLAMCGMLGWPADDSNCGDALALWSYTVALINPAFALQTTPLFSTWGEVARTRAVKG